MPGAVDKIEEKDGGLVISTIKCPNCGLHGEVAIPPPMTLGFWYWATDILPIQEALPDLSSAQREQLLSGMHSACFDEWYPEEDDG